ncbi:SDR family oxidoreductase [Phenylobacterium sp.]|uniref:SDR family oxidoreductase n=1 Tax=Phenylobacterium sp. TaxID=1871053 RepID=UPI00301B92C4
MTDLVGRIAVVTGCRGGLGTQTCRRLAEAGAIVVGADIVKVDDKWARDVGASYTQLDVTREADWGALADRVGRLHGRLDILVHNAGVVAINTIAETSLAEWKRIMAVNADGPFLGTRAMLPLLRDAGAQTPFGASVVVISSVAGLVGTRFCAAYGASKGASRLFAKAAAVEFAALSHRIRVNSVHPGGVQTAMVDHIFERYVEAGIYPSVEEGRRRTGRVMGGLAAPDDIAKAVRFLASDAAGHMNGAELVIDGGFTAA